MLVLWGAAVLAFAYVRHSGGAGLDALKGGK